MEIVHNYFETVAPDQKNAPRLGLPRRHLWRDDVEAAGGGARGDGGGRARWIAPAHAAAGEANGPGDATSAEPAAPKEEAQ